MQQQATLIEVLNADQLDLRMVRTRKLGGTTIKLDRFAGAIAQGRRSLLQNAVEAALEITLGTTAGISVSRNEPECDVLEAVAGVFAFLMSSELPQFHSESGPLLHEPRMQPTKVHARHFHWLPTFSPKMCELLVVPLCTQNDREYGSIWVLTQDESIPLDHEDANCLTELAGIVSAALELQEQVPWHL